MICEVCNDKSNKLVTCTDCDAKFCENCGDMKREMCDFCIAYKDSDNDSDFDEE